MEPATAGALRLGFFVLLTMLAAAMYVWLSGPTSSSLYQSAAMLQPVSGSPRLGYVSYTAQAPLMAGGPSMAQVAAALGRRGHPGAMVSSLEGIAAVRLRFDVIIAHDVRSQSLKVAWAVKPHGKQAAVDVADYAAEAGIPVIRFTDSDSSLHPALERPAVLVLTGTGPCPLTGVRTLYQPEPGGAACEQRTAVLMEAERLVFKGMDSLPALEAAVLRAWQRQPPAAAACALPTSPQSMGIELVDEGKASLGIVMIVKDEADYINQTLASVRAHVDYWTIVDTGSTDSTVPWIKAAMAGVPGQLLQEPFRNFAHSRNQALRAHGNATKYVVVLDGDHTLEEAWRLRHVAARLARECRHRSLHLCSQAANVVKAFSGKSHLWTRVFPTEGLGTEDGWHYIYPIHEMPVNDRTTSQAGGQTFTVPHVTERFIEAANQRSWNKSSRRFEEFDLPLLTQLREEMPADTRVAFYRAQTLLALSRWEDAIAAFDVRLVMAPDNRSNALELYESRMKQADCLEHLERSPLEKLKEAAAGSPQRAEPLTQIARWHGRQLAGCAADMLCKAEHHMGAYLYARRAMELPLPVEDGGLYDTAVYGPAGVAAEMMAVHAFSVARHSREALEHGWRTTQQLAQARPKDERLRANVAAWHSLRAQFKRT